MKVYVVLEYELALWGEVDDAEIVGVYASEELAREECEVDGRTTFVVGPFEVVEKSLVPST